MEPGPLRTKQWWFLKEVLVERIWTKAAFLLKRNRKESINLELKVQKLIKQNKMEYIYIKNNENT